MVQQRYVCIGILCVISAFLLQIISVYKTKYTRCKKIYIDHLIDTRKSKKELTDTFNKHAIYTEKVITDLDRALKESKLSCNGFDVSPPAKNGTPHHTFSAVEGIHSSIVCDPSRDDCWDDNNPSYGCRTFHKDKVTASTKLQMHTVPQQVILSSESLCNRYEMDEEGMSHITVMP